MSFFDYIEQLRKKPEEARLRFVLFVSVAVTSVIFIIWVVGFAATFSKPDTVPEGAAAAASANALSESWQKLMGQVGELFSGSDEGTAAEADSTPAEDAVMQNPFDILDGSLEPSSATSSGQ